MRLQVPAGAGGGCELAVRLHLADRDAVRAHQAGDELVEPIELVGGGALDLEVAQAHDADVVLVLPTDVGALPGEGAALPHIAARIDDEVVADIAEVSREVRLADLLEAVGDVAVGAQADRVHAVVVDGDPPRREHPVHALGDGPRLRPR